jgi:ADP-ribosylglycohydrolase
MKIIPVTCLYAGKPELQAKITDAIRVHQNDDRAVAFGMSASRILEAVLLGAPLDQALSTCQENIAVDSASHKDEVVGAYERAKSAKSEFSSMADFLTAFSHELSDPQNPRYNIAARNCALPGALSGPLYLMYKAGAGDFGDHPYLPAVRQNILAAGDTCGRSTFIGAVLAALDCEFSPPQGLIDKVDPVTYAKVEAAAQAIAESVVQ